jgi:hypothetical protein
MLTALRAFLPPPKVRTLAALQQLLDREAAFLAQRSIFDFARNELGNLSPHAFADDRFHRKLAVCRWEGFAATLADMVVLAHAHLLQNGIDRATLDRRLGDVYEAILLGHPVPEHRRDEGRDWQGDIAILRQRLAARPAGPAHPQADAEVTGGKVFDTLPFPPRDPRENRMVLANAFAFGLIAFNGRLRRLVVTPAMAAELAAP